jgi:hypothetical protein
VVGLSLFAAVVLGIVVWLAKHDSTYHAPLGGPTARTADSAGATRLLGRLVADVRHRDPAGQSLGATPAESADLRGVVRNARALHVAAFSLRYVDAVGGVSAEGSWAADVAATWRFAGFDQQTVRQEVRVRFAHAPAGLRIAGIGGGDRRSPLWLAGPVQVRRSARSMVLVAGSAARADRFAALARRAVPQVRSVLPSWRGGLVVEVPTSEDGLEAELHAHPGQYAGIAAVTTTVDGSRSRRASSHVFVNPQVFDPLRPRGAQVVITHESTHVALDAANSPAASRISSLVRHDGVPEELPTTAQFAPDAPHLEARYESAWLACRLLAKDGGTPALVAFYRAMDAGGELGPELRQHFGLAPVAFTRQWRDLLSHVPS